MQTAKPQLSFSDAVAWGAFDLLVLSLAMGGLAAWGVLLARRGRWPEWLAARPRIGVPWTGWDVALLWAGILLIDFAIGWALVPLNRESDAPLPLNFLLAVGAAHLAWLPFCVLYLASKARALADDLGFETSYIRQDLRVGLAIFLASLVPVYAVQWLMTHFWQKEHAIVQLVHAQHDTGTLVGATLLAVFAAPLFEEFMFRVLLQGWLENLFAARAQSPGADRLAVAAVPILIPSALFAVLHGWPDMVPLFVLGLFLGLAYRQTHRIYASLVAHMSINALAIVSLWLQYVAPVPG